jgi:protein-tyrosine phosphatase
MPSQASFVDIHSHILPGLDDGPEKLDDCVAMVRMAAETGTTDMVASPHSDLTYTFQPEMVAQRIHELAAASGNVLAIHTGCDFHLHYENIVDALANPTKYTINHKCYLLVEFSDLLMAKPSDEIMGRLLDAGMAPVVTHPERNSLLQRRLDLLDAWVGRGCYLQVTAQSFLGRFGANARDFANELMKRGMVHFVASDAHDPNDRTPRLDGAFAYVANKYGEPRARQLFIANPRAALTGEVLPTEEPAEAPPQRKWYQFWA